MYDKIFEVSRENMVNNQIITNKVINSILIDAILDLEKERFIPSSMASLTYSDSEIPFNSTRSLMKTFVFAKMVEFCDVKQNDSILVIGCLTGYSVAILSKLAGYVFGLDDNKDFTKRANKLLGEIACHNCSVSHGDLRDGLKKNRPFDKIIIEGAVESIPENITDQLKDGGRIFAIFKDEKSFNGQFMLGLKVDGLISYRHLFDANARNLEAFSNQDNKNDFKN